MYTSSFGRCDSNGAPMQLDNLLAQRQTQARTSTLPKQVRSNMHKTEQLHLILCGNTETYTISHQLIWATNT